jgi:hypothetical protein
VLREGKTPQYPLRFLARVQTRAGLWAYLNDVVISDIARTGVDHRRELNESFSTLERLVLRDEPKGVFEPGSAAVIRAFLDSWQSPDSGYWGARYVVPGRGIVQQDDLSITFHNISYVDGRVNHWDKILDTTLANVDRNQNVGPLIDGQHTNHMNLDVARIFRLGWSHATPDQQAQIRIVLQRLLDWCLRSSLQADGSFAATPFMDRAIGERFYFGVAFLSETGYLTPANRFWTDGSRFGDSEEVRQRIAVRIEAVWPASGTVDPYLQRAARILRGEH